MARLCRGWAMALAALLALGAPAAHAGWPPAMPAQPLVQAPRICAPGIVPINRRCRVIDFAKLGDFEDRSWYYAFYDTHWADRHGSQDRGFPVVFVLQGATTLRLSLWIDDAPGLAGRWALTPPARPVVIERPPATYVGFTLKAAVGPDDQRLFRFDGRHWKAVDILHRSSADQARLDALTPPGCSQSPDWEYDWQAFDLRAPLKTDLGGGDCGTVIADLDVRRDQLSLIDARLLR
jgi:hypothetical protein